jgi:type VI secretion system protein ImpC
MEKTGWRSEVRLVGDASADEQPAAREADDARRFVITVIGDFSGATDRPATRRLIDVDRDNLDAVMDRCHVQWRGTLDAPAETASTAVSVRLTFRELDDFHPDRIVARVPALSTLLETRRALEDPRRCDEVAAEVMRWAGVAPHPVPDAPAASGSPLTLDPSDLLERILDEGRGAAEPPSAPPRSSELQRLVEHVVGPHLVKVDRARQAALVEAVDGVLAQHVRSVLHDPAFQHIEAAWRSLRRLVRAAETGTRLKVRILDLSKGELQHASEVDADLDESLLGRQLLEPRPDPPSLVIGNYEFANTSEDIGLLRALGGLAQRLRAPFVAAASPALFGCDSFDNLPTSSELRQRFEDPRRTQWMLLRGSPEARWLALALPRLLCRLPYGTQTEPIESFAFEEYFGETRRTQLLWGNPAFGVASVVANAFTTEGWALNVSAQVQTLDGFPLYVCDRDGTAETTPCAEVLLSERLLEAFEEAGLVPLVSYRDSDVVAFPCVQSLATPSAPLLWGQ